MDTLLGLLCLAGFFGLLAFTALGLIGGALGAAKERGEREKALDWIASWED